MRLHPNLSQTVSVRFSPSGWRPLATCCALSALLLFADPPFGHTQPVDLDGPAASSAGPQKQEEAPSGVIPPELSGSGSSIPTGAPAILPPTAPAALPVTLVHPEVINSATFSAEGQTARLFGIIGVGGEIAHRVKAFVTSAGDSLTCTSRANDEYVCLLPDGTDIAMAALVNGTAQTRSDASDKYRQQESAAQAARRGIWANLPPPPVSIKHPVVRDTATLEANHVAYLLDGIEGVAGQPAVDLQAFIAANGDVLTCQQQGMSAYYTCLMPDGTDLAKIVLVNGAAHVAVGATDIYRLQQREAIANKRGIWAAMAPGQIVSYEDLPPPQPDDAAYVVEADPASDGISYVGGQPTALVDGEVAFLVLGGAAGWGYYDHFHHWRGAPERFAHHLERFHPEGRGLRGYGPGGVRETYLRGEEFRPGGLRNASYERHGEIEHPGNVYHPDVRRQEIVGRPEVGHLALPGRMEQGRPGVATPQFNRVSVTQPRPNFSPAGGFGRPMTPSPMAGRPGGAIASAPHIAPAAAAPHAAPAVPAKHK